MLSSRILTIDALISFSVGLVAFLAPSHVGDLIFQNATDGVHWHLIRCIGGQLLAGAVFFYRFRKRGLETRTACFILRIQSCILLVFLLLHIKSQQPQLIDPVVRQLLVYSALCGIAIYFLQLLLTGWKVGDTLYRSAPVGNALYQLDTMASIAIGLAWIAHPTWLLHRQVKIPLNQSHELCGRVMGSLFVASQVLSAHALHWRNRSDRLMAAEARALCCAFILVAQVWSQLAYEDYWSGGHWVGIGLFSTWTLIAIGYRTAMLFTTHVNNEATEADVAHPGQHTANHTNHNNHSATNLHNNGSARHHKLT